jgi:transposase
LDANLKDFMNHSKDVKLDAVKRYLRGGIVYRDLAAGLGVSKSVLQRWVAWYRVHGDFDAAKATQKPDAEFKLSALRHMWENRLSYAQVTRDFKIAGHNTLREWERQYRQDGVVAFLPDPPRPPAHMTLPTTKPEQKASAQLPVEELLAQIAQLKMENAYLKKLQALVQSQRSKALVKKRK